MLFPATLHHAAVSCRAVPTAVPCRRQVGLVSQEPTLFATTIYENIEMGRRGATREEVEEAARSANAHSFIMALPEK